ncbi:hypothetical protein PPYR_12477 [Photinus pyralis]|uniref:Uncharacterized protein n=1 Tax=Photinus pyralis TaxID=7054 RepID=A0A5N4AEI1_PHOPY|nr:hypothetical protein PPYR_12477 [Photinus pyralis]
MLITTNEVRFHWPHSTTTNLTTVNRELILYNWVTRRRRPAAASLLLAAGSAGCLRTQIKKQKRWWIRPWLVDKNEGGLKLAAHGFKRDIGQFKKFLRMSESTLNKLLKLVTPKIAKSDTFFREASNL